MVGADKIIGVDINPARQAMARKFGMTHFINPKEVESVVDAVVQITDGGADYSFECIGNTQVMRQALECTHKGWGRSIITISYTHLDVYKRQEQAPWQPIVVEIFLLVLLTLARNILLHVFLRLLGFERICDYPQANRPAASSTARVPVTPPRQSPQKGAGVAFLNAM